jgi:hypothetical protein
VFVTPLLLSAAIVEELELVWLYCGWRRPPTAHSNQFSLLKHPVYYRPRNQICSYNKWELRPVNDVKWEAQQTEFGSIWSTLLVSFAKLVSSRCNEKRNIPYKSQFDLHWIAVSI